MTKELKFTDVHNQKDVSSLTNKVSMNDDGRVKRTQVTFFDADTMEVLHQEENKVLITGSMEVARKMYGVELPVIIPNYNTELGLENTDDYSQVEPMNEPRICLFCVGDSGCGELESDVIVAHYTDRIAPLNDIMPFRYVDPEEDLDSDLREQYFGRKVEESGKIAYYFKTFATTPQIHMAYTDGTEITEEIYTTQTTQDAECYVEMNLFISRNDFREYIDSVKGWDKARISTLSLCYGWYDDTIDEYKWFQQIYPYSKLNFTFESLFDSSKALMIQYRIYY